MSDISFEQQERLRILEEDQAVLEEILPELRRRRIAEGRKYQDEVAARMQQELNASSRRCRASLDWTGNRPQTSDQAILRSHPIWEISELAVDEPYLLVCKTPDPFSSAREWTVFRDKMSTLMAANPSQRMPQAYVAWVDKVLAWRQTIPEHLQFWDLD